MKRRILGRLALAALSSCAGAAATAPASQVGPPLAPALRSMAFYVVEHKGYDAAAKRWVHLAVVNDGSWGIMSSPGWTATGSQMVFTPADRPDGTQATFTKISETAYSHSVSRTTDKGSEKLWEKRCTKA